MGWSSIPGCRAERLDCSVRGKLSLGEASRKFENHSLAPVNFVVEGLFQRANLAAIRPGPARPPVWSRRCCRADGIGTCLTHRKRALDVVGQARYATYNSP